MSNFVDTAVVECLAGKGGDGLVAFRREKFVPDGGPAGGDGGRGGDVIFEVDEGMSSLRDFKYKRHFKADGGENGKNKSMHGRDAEDLIVSVPGGTVVRDAGTGALIADLKEHGQRVVVAKGGRGGRGNKRFANHLNKAPEIAENGEPGQEIKVTLELKVLADAGLVGYPSVGKSTILSVVTGAKPKIADYPFTTLQPNLGVVELRGFETFNLADIPGLIEGASEGVGLGIEFLRHIERTRVLIHVLDMGGYSGRDPFENFETINAELKNYAIDLSDRPQILVANKMDLPDAKDQLALFKMEYKETYGEDVTVYEISAATGQGLDEVMRVAYQLIQETPLPESEEPEEVVYQLEEEEPAFEIVRESENEWYVGGERLLKLVEMTNFDYDEAVRRFVRQMRGMGIEEALREAGAKDGDTIYVGCFIFEFEDN